MPHNFPSCPFLMCFPKNPLFLNVLSQILHVWGFNMLSRWIRRVCFKSAISVLNTFSQSVHLCFNFSSCIYNIWFFKSRDSLNLKSHWLQLWFLSLWWTCLTCLSSLDLLDKTLWHILHSTLLFFSWTFWWAFKRLFVLKT